MCVCVCVSHHQTMMVKVSVFVWWWWWWGGGLGSWTPVYSSFPLHTQADRHMDRFGLFLWEEGVTGQR